MGTERRERSCIRRLLQSTSILLACCLLQAEAKDTIYSFALDSDPGWATEGEWQFGTPLGQGGDPSTGHTGDYVYGYNLGGSYSNSMGVHYLTTPALDCAGYASIELDFWRWLGVESPYFDHATIEVSTDDQNWEPIWSNDSFVWDYAWSNIVLDISTVASNLSTVYLRWGMGPTDSSVTYCGWNIDDVRILGDKVDDLKMTPSGGLEAWGYEGNTPSPQNITYELTNIGSSSIDWKIATTESWISVHPSSGTLGAAASTVIVVWLNSEVQLLPEGDYSSDVVLLNTVSEYAQHRTVSVHIDRNPGEIDITDSIPSATDHRVPFGALLEGMSSTGHITVANLDTSYDLIISEIELHGEYFNDFESGEAADWVPDQASSWSVVAGEYKAEVSGQDYMVSYYAGDSWDDLSVSAFCRRSGSIYSAAGIALRTSVGFDEGAGDGYVFSISASGSYCIWKQIDGAFTWLQSWTSSAAINADTNILTASAEGTDLRFLINGIPVWDGTDSDLTAGHIGVCGFSMPGDETTHFFDNVDVSDPITAEGSPTAEQAWYNGHTAPRDLAKEFDPDWVVLPYNGSITEPSRIEIFSSQPPIRWENVPSTPLVIAPGDAVTIDVVYEPTSIGDHKAHIVFLSNDHDEPALAVHVTGARVFDYLDISPATASLFSGHPGGPFAPDEQVYALSNRGPVSVVWEGDVSKEWFGISPVAGTLEAGSQTNLTVHLESGAEGLAEGVNTGKVTVSDLTTGIPQERDVSVTVFKSPEAWVAPTSIAVTNFAGMLSRVPLSIGNSGDAELNVSVRAREIRAPAMQSLSVTMSDTALPAGHDFSQPLAGVQHATNSLIVRFADPAIGRKGHTLLNALGSARIVRKFKLVPGLCVVELPTSTEVSEALQSLNADAGILYAEPNYEVKAFGTIPDDVDFDELWGMHNTGQTGGTEDADIDAPEAWDMHVGRRDVVVAVIDTGVDYTHEDLVANVWTNEGEIASNGIDDDGNGYVDDVYGYDFHNSDADPMDDHGHGTHCAGTIGAEGDNGIGVVGVNWQVRIMALKFLSSFGSGSTVDAISCIEYATAMGAHVMNNSWGGGGYSQALKDAIDAAGTTGVVFAAAAGNDYGNDNDASPQYPAGYDSENIIAVMSTDHEDSRSYFSNYGETSVDIGAPGSDILSCKPGNDYQTMSGTSMATPHVAGASAMLRAINPMLTPAQIRAVLMETADPTLPGECVSGGRLNLASAVAGMWAPWLTVVPDSAAAIVPGAAVDVEAILDASDLKPGEYQGEIIIATDDVEQPQVVVPVVFDVMAPEIAMAPDTVEFETSWGEMPTTDWGDFAMTNEAGVSVTWEGSRSVSWIDIPVSNGTLTAGEVGLFYVVLNDQITSFSPGVYFTQVSVSNTTSGCVQQRDVRLIISPPDGDPIHNFTFDSNPGWTAEAGWAFGTPLGNGSHAGDPLGGHTDINVYGYNLNGDYENDLTNRYLTTGSLDCSNYRDVVLSFYRWLGVEHSAFDHAQVEVSSNGTHWTSVWSHDGGTISDAAWSNVIYDISGVADNQSSVFLRWSMGPTDSSETHPGWNIDDVVVSGVYMDNFMLSVESEHGTTTPALGENVFAAGATVVCSVVDSPVLEDNSMFLCTGWQGTGCAPATGTSTNTGSFILTNDTSVIWHWETNYWLHTYATGNGGVSVDPGWFENSTSFWMSATASLYSAFGAWEGDTNGCDTVHTQILVRISHPRQIGATFVDETTARGTPFWWLAAHDLTNGGFAVQDELDLDDDGMPAWKEWIAGTDPNDPLSVFHVVHVAHHQAGRVPVTFTTVPGRTYSVRSCTDLSNASWALQSVASREFGPLSSASAMATAESMTLYVPSGGHSTFYCILVEQ
ncbi:MAG: S8 family serine peptidase [Kiritimatiellae bacterium]|nr:S8 family serine peptidase [Kiritimatiellia bacterium]